jgi:hypothetical protein
MPKVYQAFGKIQIVSCRTGNKKPGTGVKADAGFSILSN